MATTLKVSLIGFMALSLLATSEAGFPRLHFYGQFLADTSTLNNDPYNYNIDNFNINRDPPCYPNYTFPHCNWNPKGSGDFRLVNCTVTKVCYQNGKCTTQDPIVGKRITGSDDTVAAKMVDLDPYFQMYTSQLWGLVVGVEGAFQGTFKVNTVMDIWQRCKEKGCPGDPGSSGYWSSVLENVSWFSNKNVCPTKTVGTFIDQLKCPRGGGSKWTKTLNIKFTVDVMNEDPLTHDFAHGRVVGSISSVDNEEALKLGFPEFNRMLWGQGVISAMDKHPILPEMKDYNHAPFYVDDVNKKVVVDLSNSLPTHLNGTLVDGGNLFLLLVQTSELTVKDGMIKNCEDVLHNPNSNVGSIGYTADEWLMKDAGIVILDIDGQNTEGELTVMVVKEEAPPCQSCQKQCLPILVEHPEGLYLGAAEDRVFRIPKPTRKTETSVEVEEDGSLWGRWCLKTSEPTKVHWSLKVFATEFGKPKQDIMFIVSLSERKSKIGLNKPKDAITFVGDNQCRDKSRRKYTTDDRGIAVIEFQTDREGLDCSKEEVKKRREQQVGGQLYVYDITKTRDKHDRCEADEDKFPPNLQTTTHLYCKHESKEIYYWVDDIYPLFQRYDNLFPVMKPLFNLASYKEVIAKNRPLNLISSLKLALEDPNHMPVTRDLSPADRDMLVKWLQPENQQYSPKDQKIELAELKANLQLALRFEWTTIPLYLSAYYSIKDGFNTKVASLLKSVVIDEMNHMALVANIINAIGWKPVLNDPEVFPTYPGPLPAGCRPDVAVQLAKCSLHQIHDVFMAIEKAECAGHIYETISSLETMLFAVDDVDGKTLDDVDGMPLDDVDEMLDNLTAKCREDVKNYEPDTIGALYIHKILCPMIDLSKSGILTFDGDQAKQYPKTINVTNLRTAIKAIHQIIDEGEGGDPCDPYYLDPQGNKTLSHYYKFAEIAHGKVLVKARSDHHDAYKQYRQDNHEQETNVCETEHKHDYFTPCDGKICCRDKYEFAGPNIPFFENAVWPTLDNPTSSKYPPGSRARKMSDRFNEKYTSLMKCLHDVFNGNPGNMKKCYGLMTSLTVDAKKMVQTPIDPDGNPNVGPNVTPTFEWYPPIN